MCLKTYTEAEARRADSRLVTGCTGGCHFDTVRCGQGGRGLSLWWPYGFRLPYLVYILSSLFIMNNIEMIGISLRIVLRCFHDLMFFVVLKIKNLWFLIPHRKKYATISQTHYIYHVSMHCTYNVSVICLKPQTPPAVFDKYTCKTFRKAERAIVI